MKGLAFRPRPDGDKSICQTWPSMVSTERANFLPSRATAPDASLAPGLARRSHERPPGRRPRHHPRRPQAAAGEPECLAYVADGADGLQIIDVSNPASPTLVGSVDTPGEAQDVVITGDRAYVADGLGGLQIVNVSAPNHPAIIGSVATP